MSTQEILQKLWEQYSKENPSVEKIHRLFANEGEHIVNDHIAFRTFNDPRVNIDVLSRPFVADGYREAGTYSFPAKKLAARHYEKEGMPRVFISEIILEEFSGKLQSVVSNAIDSIPGNRLESSELVLSGRIFGVPSYGEYEKLRGESEYAAWLYVHGYRANHFTVSVNHLEKFKSLEAVNDLNFSR